MNRADPTGGWNTALEVLDLCVCGIGAAGASALAHAMRANQRLVLKLRNNDDIDDAARDELADVLGRQLQAWYSGSDAALVELTCVARFRRLGPALAAAPRAVPRPPRYCRVPFFNRL